MKKDSIISKDFILLFLFSVMVCTGMNMLNVIVPLYVTESLRQTTAVAGLMTTVYTVASCVSRPINGALSDILSRRVMMTLGSLLFCAACLVSGLLPFIAVLAVCRVLMGIGYSAASTANNTASTDVIPASRLAEGIGYFGMSQSVASAFGPALASVVIVTLGNQYSLVFTGAIIAAALLVTLLIRYEASPSYKKPEAKAEGGGNFFERSAIVPSIYQGLSLFLISCIMCFMTLYIVSRGLSSAVAGSFFVVASVMIIGVRLLCSGLMNRLIAAAFLIPSYLLLIVSCILLIFADSTAMFMLCAVTYGLSHGTIWMVLGSEAVRFAPADRRGAANATFYFAFDASIGIGAAFWGFMIDQLGYAGCFQILALLTAVLALSVPAVFRRRKLHYQGTGV